jgi:prepilin-type N-terminal cleavage/methylation domain-containing protein
MNRSIRTEAGYSLAEMLTVVAIIGILALVMIPNFMSFYQSNKMKSSMRNFTSDLRSVRQLSITQGRQAMLTYGTGPTARTYNWWLGNRPFSSTAWTPQTGSGQVRPTKEMDSVVYFPTNAPASAQSFRDDWNCSSGTNCVQTPAGNPTPDGLIEVIFFPDGRVQIPAGLSSGTITIKTDQNIPKPEYAITVSPSGRVVALEEVLFANLGAPGDGTVMYCSDCMTANPCASGGSGGAVARRTGGTWVCN